ncbi:hypothetical protein [Streptomyces sp. NPDC088182]|uniref:hypothetical protein n=1 Tax=Streptomyces sp. NPDC088182 TaxID=3365838 RepID=UPI00381D7F57
MTDSPDEMMEILGDRVAETYIGLVMICAGLPVPIELPTGVVDAGTLTAAVRRVSEIAEDQPMPEAQVAGLYTASILYLAALDLLGMLQHNAYEGSRMAGALGILVLAQENLKDLAGWLAEDDS